MEKGAPTAQLVEVFSAIQGEGLNVGTRQLFIRFGICDLRCRFCDSAHTWYASKTCRIERSPGLRDFEAHPNPVSLASLLSWVDRQNQPVLSPERLTSLSRVFQETKLHDSISLTGGEPLLHAPFLVQFLPQVRQQTGLPIYLETGGHRPDQLSTVLPYLDSVGMDLKLSSVSGETRWQAHCEFLHRCRTAQVDVFVKIIISSQTNLEELVQAAELVAVESPEIPVFLQPVTPLNSMSSISAPSPEQVLAWQALMKPFLKQVRVIPQTHKFINQL